MKKRLLSLILALIMTLSLVTIAPVSAAENHDHTAEVGSYIFDDFEYTISNGEVTITGCGEGWGNHYYHVVIPSEIAGYPVTRIGDGAFFNKSTFISITIPKTITYIGYWALFSTAIRDVYIEDIAAWCNIQTYSSSEFGDIMGENTNLYINNVLVKDLVIPEGVKYIPSFAFYCKNIETVHIPASVSFIDHWSFGDKLKSISVAEDNTAYSCEDGVLFNKDKTELISVIAGKDRVSYDIPDGVTVISSNAFSLCEQLESVTIPESVSQIGFMAFYGCSSLKGISIPNGVVEIGLHTFADCDSLTSIVLPESITKIEDEAFDGCSSLEVVYYLGTSSQWDSIKIDYGNTELNRAKILTFDSNETLEFDGLMYKMTAQGVDIVGYSGSEEDLVIPETIQGLQVVKISEKAFEDNRTIKSITIPASVTTIEKDAFNWCSAIEKIVVDENNKVYDSRDNCNAVIKTESNELVLGCSTTVIPESVTSIGAKAFVSSENFTSITIPKNIERIGEKAFGTCYALEDVYFNGSWEQWNNIVIAEGNSRLICAKRHIAEVEPLFSIWDIDVCDGEYTEIDGYYTMVLAVPQKAKWENVYVCARSSEHGPITKDPGIKMKKGRTWIDEWTEYQDYVAYIPQEYNLLTFNDGGTQKTYKEIEMYYYDDYDVDEIILLEGYGEYWYYSDTIDVDFYPIDKDSVIEGRGYTAEDLGQNEIKFTVSDKPGVKFDSVNGTAIGYIGDSDGNNTVNVKDATNIQKCVADLVTFTEKAVILSDVDDSGVVNVRDATTIQKYVAGMNVTAKVKHLVYEEGEHKHCYRETIVTPKCILTGYTSLSCICGAEKVLNYVPATGEHTYTKKVIKPTCTQDGYTLTECKYCNKSNKSDYTKATGHDYVFVKVEKEATCISGRYDLEKCSKCGNEHYNISTAPGHSYTTVVTKPTCDKQGYTTYTCTRCNESHKDNYTNATGHNYGSDNICKICKKKVDSKIVAFDKLMNSLSKSAVFDDGYRTSFVCSKKDTNTITVYMFSDLAGSDYLSFDVYFTRGGSVVEYDLFYGANGGVAKMKGTIDIADYTKNTLPSYYSFESVGLSAYTTRDIVRSSMNLLLSSFNVAYFDGEVPVRIEDLGFVSY